MIYFDYFLCADILSTSMISEIGYGSPFFLQSIFYTMNLELVLFNVEQCLPNFPID